jgi:hypothetical protein
LITAIKNLTTKKKGTKMKKIINGLRYDTAKAIEVGSYHTTGRGTNDFSYWKATLYKTPRSGRFFLAGEGHAMTQFGEQIGDSRGWGEKIIPMTDAEALAWAEQYLDAAEIEEHFGAEIEDA